MTLDSGVCIEGTTKVLGLIGSNIGHTLSPFIHNLAASQLGVEVVYLPFDVAHFPEEGFFCSMWEAGAHGFNVTVPFKEAAAAHFSQAGLCSVNTIYRGDKGWEASSTDGMGFLRGLKELALELKDFEAVIFLGNGGGALGLRETFQKLRKDLPHFVLRRSPGRDETWQQGSLVPLELHDFDPVRLQELIGRYPKSLLIQSTSAPLQGDRLNAFMPSISFLKGAFIDLVYGRGSAILDQAKVQGLPSQDGIPMLIGQALLAQDLWWGRSSDFSFLEKALRRHLAAAILQ